MADIGYSATPKEYEAQLGDYFALLKPRVMSLVVFTALVGLLAAPVSVNPIIAFASILFVAIGAGASGALNMWWDADIDAVMRRTTKRPIPSGRVQPSEALNLGAALSFLSIMMLAVTAAGQKDAYTQRGYQEHPIRAFLTPLEQTAKLCHMHFSAPYVLYGSLRAPQDDLVAPHAKGYRRLLEAIRDDRYDLQAALRDEVLCYDNLPIHEEA